MRQRYLPLTSRHFARTRLRITAITVIKIEMSRTSWKANDTERPSRRQSRTVVE